MGHFLKPPLREGAATDGLSYSTTISIKVRRSVRLNRKIKEVSFGQLHAERKTTAELERKSVAAE